MILPQSPSLPIHYLAACFNNTSATYKFYWFLGILDAVEQGQTTIEKKVLFASMISNAWYTVNYFHLSFGKQDMLQRAIENVKLLEDLEMDEKKSIIHLKLTESDNPVTVKNLRYFDSQVPHWFLSPWFRGQRQVSTIYDGSRTESNKCLYALYDTYIVVNPAWTTYLMENVAVLRSFCYWHLAIYLQSRNPNVPDIPNKLIRPAKRSSLIKQRKEYWDIVIENNPNLKCIYTNMNFVIGDYHVEHFVPFSFVSHDLIWNLIPADKNFNSRKSDKLPPQEVYFDPFYHLQVTGIDIVRRLQPKNRFLQDYLTILPGFSNSTDLWSESFKAKFRDTIGPLISIAANNGFEFMS
jgi:hypothetical protein